MIKAILTLMALIAVLICGWIGYLRIFEPEKYAEWEAETARENAKYQAEREAEDAADKKQKEEKIAARLAKRAAEEAKIAAKKAKQKNPSYRRGEKAGWDDGYRRGFGAATVFKFIVDERGKRPEGDIAVQNILEKKNKIYKEAYCDAYVDGYEVGWQKGVKERDIIKEQQRVKDIIDLLAPVDVND